MCTSGEFDHFPFYKSRFVYREIHCDSIYIKHLLSRAGRYRCSCIHSFNLRLLTGGMCTVIVLAEYW